MDGRTVKDDELEEEISESFLCCVCLELLYKPIVLSCGHISCFWCVHKSMNVLLESHCPICRNPYLHFPAVCQELHSLLQKMYPIEYKKREEQILMEEREMGFFSPQIDTQIGRSNSEGELDSVSSIKDDSDISNCKKPKAAKNLTAEEKILSSDQLNGKCELISTADLLCKACEQMLFRPVVLNCGHVFCEACVANPGDENEKIRCQVCQTLDPRGFPRVCLVLNHFIQERFPIEYASRRPAVDSRQDCTSTNSSSQNFGKGGLSLSSSDNIACWAHPGSNVHIGVGCDSCGICPIIGDRYRCMDCKEEIGYDLCGECYNTRSKLPGRFNQQHTSDHRLELVNAPQIRFLTRIQDGIGSPFFLNVVPEASDMPDASVDDTSPGDAAEYQNDEQSSYQNEDGVESGEQNNRQFS